ncbi:Nrap protein [Circinella umbellata]|nr:Nrap protein [Circinella umbellata]
MDDDDEEGDWESQSDEDGSDEEEGEGGESKTNKKRKTDNEVDNVTGGELEGLKETAELYKSNIFKLEIDELLQEVNVNYDKHKTLLNALKQLKSVFENIPEGKEELVKDYIKNFKKKQKIVAPILQSPPPEDALYKFKFEKPSSIQVVGSYALKTITKLKRAFNVDVAVQMPSSIFQEKDYTNNRYFYKRACYLATLAHAIQKSKKNFNIEFSTFNGDAHRPILIVKPTGDKSDVDFSKTRCIIRIIPTIAQDVFPPYRLAPNRNNIRHNSDNSVATTTSTPQYNASILMDTSLSPSLAFLYEHSKNCAGFKDAIMLGRVWLYQRELESNRTGSGFSAFLFAMLMGYLLQGGLPQGGRKLSTGHSSYQLLRGTIDFLSTHDFEKEPVMIGEYDHPDFAVDHFRENYQISIVDPTGTVNLAAHLTPSGLAQVQYEAKLAMASFNDTVDRFDTLFLRNVNDIKARFDNAFTIPVPNKESAHTTYTELAQSECPILVDHFAKSVSNVLQRGLTNRVDLVAVQYDADLSWPINSTISSFASHIKVGLVLNPDNSPRLVDQGPDAQQKEACESFRQFWGDKAELRRFKDGSIVESVVWETQGYENRTLIVKSIVQYLLQHHFELEPGLIWTGQQVYPYLHLSKHVPANLFSRQLDVSGFQPVMTAYTQFAKQLRDVDTSLPILINNIYPASSGLRYTSACVPHPMDFDHVASHYPVTARYIDAMDVIVQLERSTKWPDDLAALQKVKYAFYLKIANELKNRVGVEAHVVAPHTDVQNDNENKLLKQGYIDVYYYGYIFRCHLHVPQESDALKNTINDKKSNDTKKKTQAQEALKAHEYLFHHQQRHTYYVQAMCVKYPAYSATVRLMKRWFGAHLLSLQISEELIELICAHVFLESHPWQPPVNALTGMTRVLELLATWDWQKGPLVVDIEGEMTVLDRDTISQRFAKKKSYITMVVATAKDLDGTRWSSPRPNKAVAARVQMLAKASVATLDKTIQSGQIKNIKSLFVTPMQDYHAVIQLKASRCTRYYQNSRPQQSLLELNEEEADILGDTVYAKFDPVTEYIKELERIYGDVILLFHDKFGGDKIGIVWNPTTAVPKQWKVNVGYNSVPVDMNKDGFLEPAKGKSEISNLVKPNFAAILREMERLGHGIIESINQS